MNQSPFERLQAPIIIRTAPVVSGAARGRRIGIPTINVDPSCAPKALRHGIYACWITLAGRKLHGAMHYGPRPVFRDSVTLEIHVLDETVAAVSETVDIEIVARIRDVLNFESIEALQKAIADDIAAVRGILQA